MSWFRTVTESEMSLNSVTPHRGVLCRGFQQARLRQSFPAVSVVPLQVANAEVHRGKGTAVGGAPIQWGAVDRARRPGAAAEPNQSWKHCGKLRAPQEWPPTSARPSRAVTWTAVATPNSELARTTPARIAKGPQGAGRSAAAVAAATEWTEGPSLRELPAQPPA